MGRLCAVRQVHAYYIHFSVYKLLLPCWYHLKYWTRKHNRLLIFMCIFHFFSPLFFTFILVLLVVVAVIECLHCAFGNIYGEYCNFLRLFRKFISILDPHTHTYKRERNLGVRARIQLSIFCAGFSCWRKDTHIYVIHKQSYNFFVVAVEESKRFSADLFIDIPTKLWACKKSFRHFSCVETSISQKYIWWTTMNRINFLLEISIS